MKGRKNGCTWCKSSKSCLPTTSKHFCEIGQGAFGHCALTVTGAPTAAPTPMIIHVVDLDGNKFTYEVTGDDVINEIKEKAAADANMDVDDVNLKEADDTILDKPFSSLDFNKIVHEDTLYMYYYIHVVTEDGTKHTFKLIPTIPSKVSRTKSRTRLASMSMCLSIADQTRWILGI